MPRSPRIHFAGALFHTMARGNAGQKIFLDHPDYQVFLQILSDLKRQKPFVLHAYCLMSNHFHLLLEVHHFSLSVIMQNLLTRYAKYFNIRHRRIGHLFQGRYKTILCQKDVYLQELVRYIHLNPVRAKLVKEPRAWLWSSHHEYLGLAREHLVDTHFVLSMFHPYRSRSRQLYTRFVQDGLEMGHKEEYYPSQTFPCLGEDTFLSEYRDLIEEKRPVQDRKRKPLPLEQLAALFKDRTSPALLRSRSQVRKITAVRRDFVLQAIEAGHRPSLIAAFLRCSPSSVSKILKRNL